MLARLMLQSLSAHDMSPERGFLSSFEFDEVALPSEFAPVVEAAEQLSGLLTSGRVRHWLNQLPALALASFAAAAP